MSYGKAPKAAAARSAPYGKGSDEKGDPSCKVYVGSLAYKTNWHTLKELFSQVGTVNYAKVLREDGPKGKGSWSRGAGLVEFSTPQEAALAIQTFNETELDGRTIMVDSWSDAAPSSPAKGHKGKGKGFGKASANGKSSAASVKVEAAPQPGETDNPACKVYIGNLSYKTKWAALKEFMAQAGTVVYAKVIEDKGKGKGFWSTGAGLAVYSTPSEARTAISSLNGAELDGREIKLDVWTSK